MGSNHSKDLSNHLLSLCSLHLNRTNGTSSTITWLIIAIIWSFNVWNFRATSLVSDIDLRLPYIHSLDPTTNCIILIPFLSLIFPSLPPRSSWCLLLLVYFLIFYPTTHHSPVFPFKLFSPFHIFPFCLFVFFSCLPETQAFRRAFPVPSFSRFFWLAWHVPHQSM